MMLLIIKYNYIDSSDNWELIGKFHRGSKYVILQNKYSEISVSKV